MKYALIQTLLPMLFGRCAGAFEMRAPAPTPAITAAPLVARDVTTIGYISTGTSDGTTLWDTVTANLQGQVIATSGSLYAICPPSSACDWISCSDDYMVFSTGASYCGGPNSTCSSYVLATDIYDHDPLTNYWCNYYTEEGGIIYKTTPDGISTVFSSSITTPSSTSLSSSSTSPTPTPTPPPAPKKSTPIGAIVGGVIGGIAVLGVVIFGVVFLLRRRRTQQNRRPDMMQYHQQQSVAQPPVQQMPPPQFYNPAQQSYPPPEKTPAATTVNAQPYYGDSGPASPVPQYTPGPATGTMNINELPAQRM